MRTRNKLLAVWCMLFLVAGVIMGTVSVASAITFDLVNLSGTKITFTGNGDAINFNPEPPSPAYDFQITGPAGISSIGLQGNISGTFTIGPITTVTPGIYETAPVNGSGTLTIFDAAGNPLTATVTWGTIFTIWNVGAMNAEGALNLTGVSYPTGGNTDLLAFASAGGGIGTMTFQFGEKKLLSALIIDGASNSTSYSATITFVPAPATVLLLGSGLVGLGLLRFRRRQKKL